MKTFQILLVVVLIMRGYLAMGQHFELPIFFQDAIGNKDTIILGYDINASEGIDASLGEIDILGTPYTKPFEVRAAMYDYEKLRWEDARIFESKKMMIKSDCVEPFLYDEENSMMVVMKGGHWPISMAWDSTLFLDSCRSMAIVECAPGGWFDVCGGNNSFLVLEMENRNRFSFKRTAYTIPTSTDTLFALFFPLSRTINVGANDPSYQNKVIVCPNPASDFLHIDIKLDEDVPYTYDIMDTQGRILKSGSLHGLGHSTLDINALPKGMYFINILNEEYSVAVQKFVKQ